MSKRAIVYARTSYDDRSNDAQNIQGQLVMGREHAKKQGYDIIAELAEDEKGASGADINLPQLTKIREMADAKLFDVLIVREVDRLSRDVAKFATISKELAKNKVSIEYCLYDFPDTPAGRLAKNQLAAIAEFLRDDIMQKTARGKLLTVRNSFVIIGATAPYGYRAVRQSVNGKVTHLKFVVHPDEAEVVKNIYTWFARDILSIHEIARKLDSSGAPKPVFAGKTRTKGWALSTVFKILRNKTYKGEWTYHYDRAGSNQEIPVEVPAIIDNQLWEAAQSILNRNKERSARATRYKYLLSRKLTCGKCGRYLSCEAQGVKGKYLYYVCPGVNNNRISDCKMRVRADIVDELAWNWITEILKDPVRLQSEIDVYQNRLNHKQQPVLEQIAKLDELLEGKRSQLNRLIDLYMSGTFTLADVQQQKTELDKRVSDLERQRKDLSSSIEGQPVLQQSEVDALQSFAREISSKQDQASFEQKRQLIEMLKVEGTLTLDEKEGKVLNLRCALRVEQDRLLIDNTSCP